MTFNPYLEGNFAPVRTEAVVDDLQIIGDLPEDINGMYVRNGPNPAFPPKGAYHWFDGDGMLHGVQLQHGKASYINRYIRTTGYEIEQKKGKAIWTGLVGLSGFELIKTLIHKPHGMMTKHTANTSLVWHDGKLLALWEAGNPHEISVPGLETVGQFDFGAPVKAFTAHPKVDSVTGEMMFFGYQLTEPPYVQYTVTDSQGQILRTVPIDIPKPVMMHDFAVTEHYTLFMDLPLEFTKREMFMSGQSFGFNPERPARFGIMPRHGDSGDMRWFEAPPCFIFHTLNAYEDGDEVVLVAARMNRSVIAPPGHSTKHGQHTDRVEQPLSEETSSRLHEWRFNLTTGQVSEKPLDDALTDFPRIHEGRLGYKARYGYSARLIPTTPNAVPLFDGILKYDVLGGDIDFHGYGPKRYGGEAVFVPRANATDEDDGYLVTFVYDANTECSELIVADAQHMDAEPIARVMMPQRVPFGFHGIWIDQTQIEAST